MFLKSTQVPPTDHADLQRQSMTAKQFLTFAADALSNDALESIYEGVGEHNNEVAMFGDSGPGVAYRLHKVIAEVNALERRVAQLQDRPVRDFRFGVRSPR